MDQPIDPGTQVDVGPHLVAPAIQPHGVLLAVDGAGRIARLAGDTRTVLGRAPEELIGHPLAAVLPPADGAALAWPLEVPTRPCHVATWSGGSGRWDIAAHRAGRHTLVEFEPASGDRSDLATVLAELRHAGEGIDAATDVRAVCRTCAQEIRRLSGFDGVWIHRFTGDDGGELMASSGVTSLTEPGAPWLWGQAEFHAVPDVGFVPVPLLPEPSEDGYPDTRRCILHGMTAASRGYLARLGVVASLSLPIVVRNRTWGMVTCHHASPRLAPSSMRACCAQVVHMSALRIEACEQAALAERARERSLLVVQEAHHRIQNSLQIVASTLRLQARQAGDAGTRSQLEAAAVRLTAVSAAHRQLSHPDDTHGVRLERHLEHLCRDLAASWGEAWDGQLIVDACHATLTADAAVGVGLVVAELLTNTVKYAYGGEPGPISVCATRDARWLRVTVSDRGYGMQGGVAGSGLGSRLTRAFATQLGGDIELSSGNQGTTATLRVPLSSIRAADDPDGPIAPAGEG